MTNSIFEEIWWLKAVAPAVNWREITINDVDGTVLARWVTARNNIKQPAETQNIGFWLNEEKLTDDIYMNRRKELINKLINNLPQRVDVYLSPENRWVLPFLWRGFSIFPKFSYRIANLSNTEEIYGTFAKIVKKNIKSARNKVEVQIGNEIDTLYNLMEKTFQAQGRRFPHNRDLFYRIYNAATEHNACRIFYAYDKNNREPHCGIMLVYDGNCCYYLLAGTDFKYRNSGANSLLLWEGIQFAATVSRVFDFEGSMIEGIETFIRQFGAKPVTYYKVCRQSLIADLKDILKPRIKRRLKWK